MYTLSERFKTTITTIKRRELNYARMKKEGKEGPKEMEN